MVPAKEMKKNGDIYMCISKGLFSFKDFTRSARVARVICTWERNARERATQGVIATRYNRGTLLRALRSAQLIPCGFSLNTFAFFFLAKGHGMRVHFVVYTNRRGKKTVELQKSFRHAKMDTCRWESVGWLCCEVIVAKTKNCDQFHLLLKLEWYVC